jgi:hypothetical protein
VYWYSGKSYKRILETLVISFLGGKRLGQRLELVLQSILQGWLSIADNLSDSKTFMF